MENYYHLDCGCKFKQLGLVPKQEDGMPAIDLDPYNLPYCDKAWEIFANGDTTGVFQLESNLGKGWSKKLKPETEEHISALTSIIRPGSLNADFDGKSMTRHYVDRKNGDEEVTYPHDDLKPILEDTYGVLCYQEGAMQIASIFAGFDLKQVDVLRKSIGKKDPKVMASLENDFVEGCVRVGKVNKEKAQEIFEWIRKSQKYSFNHCITPDTIVQTPDGPKTIDELKVGDYVLNHRNEYIKVLNKFENGVKDVVKIITKSGKEIICTPNHRFLTENNQVRTILNILERTTLIMTCDGPEEIFFHNVHWDTTRVVDIEVDSEDHLYLQNGFVGHNSHGASYGQISYVTAYLKAHFPTHFFTSWLYNCDDQDETEMLVTNLKTYNIDISPPSIKTTFIGNHGDFGMSKKGIHFGVGSIKGIGKEEKFAFLNALEDASKKLSKKPEELTWIEILAHVGSNVSITTMKNSIASGCFDYLRKQRKEMLYELDYFLEIKKNKNDLEFFINNSSKFTDLCKLLENYSLRDKKDSGPKSEIRRKRMVEIIATLKKPPFSLKDTVNSILSAEKELLGIPISYNKLDACDTYAADSTVVEFKSGKTGKITLAVEIKRATPYTIKKNGKVMGFLTVEDHTGDLDVVCFTDQWDQYKHILYVGNTVLLAGEKSKDKDSLVVKEVYSI